MPGSSRPTDFSKHDVAECGGHTIREAIDGEDENVAMQIMAKGAAMLASRLHRDGAFDAVIVLGGTMGTDLATIAAEFIKPKFAVPVHYKTCDVLNQTIEGFEPQGVEVKEMQPGETWRYSD